MFQSVHAAVAAGVAAYATAPRHEWVLQWPGMVVLVVTALFWTEGVTAALRDGTAAAYEKQCTCAFADLSRCSDSAPACGDLCTRVSPPWLGWVPVTAFARLDTQGD